MTTFPALVPSSRTFTPGEYPATAFNGFSGAQNRVRHSNVFLSAQLRLTFLGLTQAQMLDIWNHYNSRRGEFRSFDLPAEVVSYGSITDYVPGNYLWRYAGPGSVEDLPCGGHNVSLTLETVPPVAASVVGADLLLRLRLTAGVAAGGEYEPGISEPLTFSIQTGAAFVALNGISESLALDLEPGAAAGDVEAEGVDLFVFMNLLNGVGANEGRDGIDETISLSLAAGAADGGAPADPDFANVSLLLHMDGSNGSTTFTDSSSNGLTVTPQADAQISTAQSKFGGASGLFDGSVDRLHLPNAAAALNLDADFTVEVWVYPLSSADMMVLSGRTGNQQVFRLNYLGTGNILCFVDGTIVVNTAAGITANVWQHLALSRSGSNARLFVDGQQQGSTNTSWAGSLSIERIAAFFFNGFLSNPAFYFNGYIDDLRITKGVARYTANFTPPTAPFPDS